MSPVQQETILVVEDNPEERQLLQEFLQDELYTTIAAADGVEAQEILIDRPSSIDCVLLDWSMPRMSGIELLHWMKQKPGLQYIPVVVQTGLIDPANIREGIEAGAFYYLTKPIQTKLLLTIVRSALNDRAYKKHLLDQLAVSQNPFGTLLDGTFRFRTPAEGERLALFIANATPTPERTMAISEIFLNAIEHGNLGISYDEKTLLLDGGDWEAELQRRLDLPANRHKFVTVSIHRENGRMEIRVEDCGSGFNYAQFLQFDESRAFDTHGRGIAMASASFDLDYADGGRSALIRIDTNSQ